MKLGVTDSETELFAWLFFLIESIKTMFSPGMSVGYRSPFPPQKMKVISTFFNLTILTFFFV